MTMCLKIRKLMASTELCVKLIDVIMDLMAEALRFEFDYHATGHDCITQ